MENEGIALSREKILNHVWNYDYFGDARTIDTHVKKLRNKMGEKGEYIKTIWFMCSPSWSSSFFPFPWYFASKSSPIMRLDISVSSNTGIVTRFVTNTTVTALKMTAMIPTYVRKRFDIVTLSLILSSGVRIIIRFPSGRIPQRT